MSKKKTGAEILKEDAAEMEAEEKALLADAVPRTPFEAAIDRATGFKADSETEKAETGTEKPETGTEKRDWVEEAYKCFIKDAKDMDPADPVTAIEIYFERHATRELLARCKAEGKDAKGCWKFIEAVARKALGGRNGHIDPAVVYAIAMHWFEDVPKDWDKAKRPAASSAPKKPAKAAEEKPAKKKLKKPAETPSEIKKKKAKAKKAAQKAKAAAKKPKRSKNVQGFFFDMLLDTPNEDDVSSPQGAPVRPAEENAVAPSAQAGTSSESEVRK
jgi:hypothetical protein